MATEDSTATETRARRIDACNSHNIMFELWERSSHTFTEEELEWFSGATDHAEHELISLKQTIENIGCLVMNDAFLEKGKQAGNLRDNDDLPDLLFSIANSLDTIQGLIHVGSSADHRLKHPELYRKGDSIKAINNV